MRSKALLPCNFQNRVIAYADAIIRWRHSNARIKIGQTVTQKGWHNRGSFLTGDFAHFPRLTDLCIASNKVLSDCVRWRVATVLDQGVDSVTIASESGGSASKTSCSLQVPKPPEKPQPEAQIRLLPAGISVYGREGRWTGCALRAAKTAAWRVFRRPYGLLRVVSFLA